MSYVSLEFVSIPNVWILLRMLSISFCVEISTMIDYIIEYYLIAIVCMLYQLCVENTVTRIRDWFNLVAWYNSINCPKCLLMIASNEYICDTLNYTQLPPHAKLFINELIWYINMEVYLHYHHLTIETVFAFCYKAVVE